MPSGRRARLPHWESGVPLRLPRPLPRTHCPHPGGTALLCRRLRLRCRKALNWRKDGRAHAAGMDWFPLTARSLRTQGTPRWLPHLPRALTPWPNTGREPGRLAASGCSRPSSVPAPWGCGGRLAPRGAPRTDRGRGQLQASAKDGKDLLRVPRSAAHRPSPHLPLPHRGKLVPPKSRGEKVRSPTRPSQGSVPVAVSRGAGACRRGKPGAAWPPGQAGTGSPGAGHAGPVGAKKTP